MAQARSPRTTRLGWVVVATLSLAFTQGAKAYPGPEPTATCPAASAARPIPPPADGGRGPAPTQATDLDYRHSLRPTPRGWPILRHWCVWIEPLGPSGPGLIWDQRWWSAVNGALATWEQQLSISRVSDPEQAQILLWRRKPSLRNNRASHGRAELQLQEVQRNGLWSIEPLIHVAISPGQAQQAIQATALHELGHAFGLWGHSEQSGDVMAVAPGAKPLLQLSSRDMATLRWLYQQPGLNQSGLLVNPAAEPPGVGRAPAAPGAN